jgi:four helix bundle protein
VLNISEGFERKTNKEFARYLNIAKGSAGEVKAVLYIANEIGYLSDGICKMLIDKTVEIGKQLYTFEKYLLQSSTAKK